VKKEGIMETSFDRKVLDRMHAILKEEGFAHVSAQVSGHSATLSADRGAERIVVHITDQQEVPHRAVRNHDIPARSEVMIAATLPGLEAASFAQLSRRTGQSGGPSKRDVIRPVNPALFRKG
jgi:hypothetical protein